MWTYITCNALPPTLLKHLFLEWGIRKIYLELLTNRQQTKRASEPNPPICDNVTVKEKVHKFRAWKTKRHLFWDETFHAFTNMGAENITKLEWKSEIDNCTISWFVLHIPFVSTLCSFTVAERQNLHSWYSMSQKPVQRSLQITSELDRTDIQMV